MRSYWFIECRLFGSRAMRVMRKRTVVWISSPQMTFHLIQNFHVRRWLCTSFKDKWNLVALVCVKWRSRFPRLVYAMLLLRALANSTTWIYWLLLLLLYASQFSTLIVSLPISLINVALDFNGNSPIIGWLDTGQLTRRLFWVLRCWHRVSSLCNLFTLKKRSDRPHNFELRFVKSLVTFLSLAWGLALRT